MRHPASTSSPRAERRAAIGQGPMAFARPARIPLEERATYLPTEGQT
jgi:hypothetical protein